MRKRRGEIKEILSIYLSIFAIDVRVKHEKEKKKNEE
jgi:hypothetical protein